MRPTVKGIAQAIKDLNDTGISISRAERRKMAKEEIKNFKKDKLASK
jgi:hypothetical protein